MTEAPPIIEFIDVSVRVRGEQLLAGVSFSVAPESIHVIVGPNGAGKTTLLGSLLAQVAFEGQILAHWRRGGAIGYVPQSFAVDASLPVTVQDFLALTRQRRPVCLGVAAPTRRKVIELLQQVGLQGLERRPLSVLSGGELRRVLLAHALDPLPELLVLDEPASGLDEGGVRQLDDLLRTVRTSGTTVVMVSHDLDQVRRIADHVTVIDRSVVTQGSPEETLALDRVLALLPVGTEPAGARMTTFYGWVSQLAASGWLPSDFQYPFLTRGFLCVLILAPLLGGLSHLVVTRRMAFFSAALGQAALTGVAIGLLLGEPLNAPYGGMFGFCLLTTLGMVYVKRHSSLPPDTLIGVFHALSLGLGLCLLVALTRQFNVHQVESVLFGSLLTVTDADLLLLVGVAVIVAALVYRQYNNLLLDSLSSPIATVAGAQSAFLEYLFAIILTLSIVVSLKVIGALLVEALVVVPAAAARNLAGSTRTYFLWSITVAFLASAGGLGISTKMLVPTGGAVVLAATAIFFLTLAGSALLRRRQRQVSK